MKISRTRKFYILFVGWMVFLTVFSLIPRAGVDLGERGDKVAHFIAYFITAFIFCVSFRARFQKADIYAVFFAFGYGAVIELVQVFVPYRVGSFLDLAANFSGVLFFFLLYRFLLGKL
ncbi:MAG: VanZ family protein [Deltaproteobacteria bacterium]|nr:VanZ family protein [Deltaproteobacteria bacterium]